MVGSYETDNLLSNHSLQTVYYYPSTVQYSDESTTQPVTEISNGTVFVETDETNWQDNCLAHFNKRYLLHKLGWTITLVVAYMLIFIIGFVGNCMVILVVLKRPQMRTVTNIFIMNLAVADLLLIIFCVPATLLDNIYRPWILGSVMCKGVWYLNGVSVGASAYSLAAISLDRCKAIYRPVVPPRGLFKLQLLFTICLIWTIAMMLTIPYAMAYVLTDAYNNDCISYCIQKWEKEFHQTVFYLYFMIFFYCLPLIVIIISNIITWRSVSTRKVPGESASASHIDKMHRESCQSVGKMLGIVTVAFLVSWFPFWFFVMKVIFVENLSNWEYNTLVPLAQLLGYSNSSINPVLYAFLSKKFRDMFKSLLPKWLLCTHRLGNNCERLSGSTATTTNSVFTLNSFIDTPNCVT